MAGEVRFHEKAIAIYGIAQNSEGVSAVVGGLKQGTITVALSTTAVVGVGTFFVAEAIVGDLIYNSGVEIGRIQSVTDNTNMVITSAAIAVTADTYSTTKTVTSGTMSVTSGATAVTGVSTAFLTEVVAGTYLYDETGAIIAQVASIADDTTITLVSNAPSTKAGTIFSVGLGAKNALAVLNLNYNTEISSEAFVYVGDELNRDEDTVITDKFSKLDFETFLPSLGIIATPGAPPLDSEVPMVDWFGAVGMATDLTANDEATFTNASPSNDFLTIEIRRTSPGISTDKVYTSFDNRGMVDLDATIGTRAKLKFDFMGNLDSVTQKTKLTADFEDQKSEHIGSLKSTTITQAELNLYNGSTPPSFTPGLKTVCFDKMIAPNAAAFEYARFLTGCVDGWSKGATPSDVTLTILEDEAGALYNPDNQLEKNHGLKVSFGTVIGKKASIHFTKLQLANVSSSTVATYTGQDIAFRNTGNTLITLS